MRLFNIVNKLIIIFAIIGFLFCPLVAMASSEGGHGGEHGAEHETPEDKHKKEDENKITKEIRRHFHNTETGLINPPPPVEGASQAKAFCMYCHGSFPHITNRVVRAIFNFHKIFIACETCHYKERLNKDLIGYRWYDGTDRTIKELKKLEQGLIESNVGPKKVLTDKDIYKKYGFKISPYRRESGKFVMMVALIDDPMPQEFMSIQSKLSADEQARYKAKIHGQIDPVGSDCLNCHTQDSQLPFRALGFTDARIKDLLQTEAAGLFKYYSRDPLYKGMTFKIRRLSGIWGIDFKKPAETTENPEKK